MENHGFQKNMEIFFSHKVVDKETAAKKTEENRRQ